MSLRVGIIGCGFIGKYHSRSLKDLAKSNDANVQVTATCDRNIDRAREYARILGAKTATDSADDLIGDPALDVLYVCAETAEHPALVARAAAAGKHVFCEKPLAKNYRDAKKMLDDVTRAGVVHQVGLVLRFSPVFGLIEHMMKTHDLGPLLSAHMRDDQFFPIRGHYASQWRGDVERAGGGTLIEHSIHDVDLFLRLFGDVERVRCHTRETSGHRGIEDVAMVTFQHRGGHQTTLSSIWHAMDERQSTRHTEIFFERGYFATEHDYFGTVTYQLDKGAPVTLSHDEVIARFLALEGLAPELTDMRMLGGLGDRRFIEAVHRGGPAFPTFAEAVAAHAVVEACYESARRGAEVAVSTITG
jgi:predicted dehydrogenase